MIVALRVLFATILAAMLAGTTWASLQRSIFEAGGELLRNPWGVMTLLDAYFGFLTFYAWVAYRETSALARIVWFVLVMLLGNIAMAAYMLAILFRLGRDARAADILLRPVAARSEERS